MKLAKPSLNPIVVKEFRSRMRGWRAFAILTFYLVFLALFSYGVYRVVLANTFYGSAPLSPLIGQSLYASLTNLSLFFVAFLMPALTATAISSENERLTLEMLQATPLSPHAILIGKLIASASYIFLLIFATIPIVSLVFTFGGVTLTDILTATLVILATAVMVGIISLFFSAWRKRTIQAMVLSYLTILLMAGGTYAIYIFWGVIIQDVPPRYILLFNPFSALGSVISSTANPSSPVFIFGLLAGWGQFIDNPGLMEDLHPLWHYTLTFYLGLSAVLYMLAARFIKPIRPRRINWLGLVGVLLFFGVYFGLSTIYFYPDVKTEQALRKNPPTPAFFPSGPPPVMIEKNINVVEDPPADNPDEDSADEESPPEGEDTETDN